MHGLSALCRYNCTVPHLTPMPCASYLLQPALGTQYPEPAHVQPEVQYEPMRDGIQWAFTSLFSPRMNGHFIRTKQLVTDSRGQLELVCPPLLFHPPFPSRLLHGTTWPSKSLHRSSYHWFCSPQYSD